MQFVDTHCHLNHSPLRDDIPGALERAKRRNVTRIILPAYDLQSWDEIEPLASSEPSVYPALGLHPWMAHEPIDFDELQRRLDRTGAVAVGEIGLDFKMDGFDRDRQLHLLSRQLEIARERDLPVLLHCRGAFEELLQAVAGFRGTLRGVIHAFSRGPELMHRLVESGLHIGLGGASTRPGARRAQKAAAAVPGNRLLLETDAPWIGMHGVDPRQVEPHHIVDIAASIGALRGQSTDQIAAITTANAINLFRFDE